MKKEEDKKEVELPSAYDYFHYNLSILNVLFNLDQIEKYALSELKINFKENIRGISYFFELALIDILSNFEGLIQNYDVSDIIHWSHSDMQEEAIKRLMNSEPVVKYIFEFNALRKKLARVRLKDGALTQKDVTELIMHIQTFKTMLTEADIRIVQNLGVKRIQNPEFEKPRIINWFLVQYNYVDGHCEDFLNWEEDKIICSYPGGAPFFYIMSDESRKSYHLEYPLVKKHGMEYLNGYKIMLLSFYKDYLTPEHYAKAKDLILNAKVWFEIHKAYGEIGRITESNISLLSPTFQITNHKITKEILSGAKITAKYELDLAFRRINNLRIKVMKSDVEFDSSEHQNLFYHVLIGAQPVQQNNVEVIEFKQVYEGTDQIEFSYAIFMPITGMLSDGSYWLFFDKLGIASLNGSYQSGGKYMIDAYLNALEKNADYHIRRYEVKDDLLKKYVASKDRQAIRIAEIKEQLKTSKGLLGQFLAYQFLAKKYDAKLVDVSKNIGATDIDVIAENKDSLFLVQAKPSFPFTNASVDYVRNHFTTIRESIPTQKKVVQILFLIREESNNNEELQHMANNNIDGWTRNDTDKRIAQVKEQLLKEGIEIVSYHQLKSMLSREHTDYLAKVDAALDYVDIDAFDNLD